MNTDDNETRVREALIREAQQVRGSITWFDVMDRRPPTPARKRWVPAAVAAAAVIVVAAAAALLASSSRSSHSPVTSRVSLGPSLQPSNPKSGAVVREFQGFADPATVSTSMITKYVPGITPATVSISWVRGQALLAVTTFGSGSCPKRVSAVALSTGNSLRLTIVSVWPTAPASPTDNDMPAACTADLSPYTTIISPPAAVTSDRTLLVEIGAVKVNVPAS
jgi:hypothetical protein